jgi:hypothetical protein
MPIYLPQPKIREGIKRLGRSRFNKVERGASNKT